MPLPAPEAVQQLAVGDRPELRPARRRVPAEVPSGLNAASSPPLRRHRVEFVPVPMRARDGRCRSPHRDDEASVGAEEPRDLSAAVPARVWTMRPSAARQIRASPSRLAVTTRFARESKRASTAFDERSTCSSRRRWMSQMRAVPSSPAETTRRPSGEYTALSTRATVESERNEALLERGVPEAHPSLDAAGCEDAAVGAELDRARSAAVPRQRRHEQHDEPIRPERRTALPFGRCWRLPAGGRPHST